jgi:hypothetical protein
MNEIHGVVVREAYKDYQPHINVRKVVERLLAGPPEAQLVGLQTVVLTNSGNLNHNQRRDRTWSRRKKIQLRKCLGLYHGKTPQSEAWVELFVDNILSYWPRPFYYIPLLRDMVLADSLYHEIGHHIHHTQRPEYKDREDVADDWKWKLGRSYFRRRYWCLIPLGSIAKAIRTTLKVLNKRKARASDGIVANRAESSR